MPKLLDYTCNESQAWAKVQLDDGSIIWRTRLFNGSFIKEDFPASTFPDLRTFRYTSSSYTKS